MNKREASLLLPLVNDPESMRLLSVYVSYRIEYCRDELEKAIEVARISELQGALKELRKMQEMRKYVTDWVSRDG